MITPDQVAPFVDGALNLSLMGARYQGYRPRKPKLWWLAAKGRSKRDGEEPRKVLG